MKIWVLIFVSLAISGKENGILAVVGSNTCNFSEIFNFGDSNSDTGGSYVYNNDIFWPNGITIGKFFKRAGDGRLIIDFFAETLGFPYLNASADTNGTSFKYGANFAVGGNRINPKQDSSMKFYYSLEEQVSRFLSFKSRAISSKEPESTSIYPKQGAFAEALYTIDIGQNDVASGFGLEPIPTILNWFTKSVQRLLENGAKYMWVHNTCPYGCLPFSLLGHGTFTRDNYGCIVYFNNMSRNFNSELKLRIDLLRNQYPEAVITLIDMYSAKYQLISNTPQGFDAALKFKYCCVKKDGFCGGPNSTACNNPSQYLSWDSVHWTEAANRVLAKRIADGTFSEPRVGILQACNRE